MALALLFSGIVFVVAAVRGKQARLFELIKGDLTGENNFVFWGAAILLLGAIGYIPKLKSFSTALLALVLVTIFVRKGSGFFDQIVAALDSTTGK